MKKKLIRIAVGLAVLLVFGALALSIAIQSYVRSDRLKSFLIAEIEENTGRKAELDSVRASLAGITLQGFSLKDKNGAADFLTVRAITLKYQLSALMKKELLITEIEINTPLVQVRQDPQGNYNFSDIVKQMSATHGSPAERNQDQRSAPLKIITDRVVVSNAGLVYAGTGMPPVSVSADADLRIASTTPQGSNVSGTITIRKLQIGSGGAAVGGKGNARFAAGSADFTLHLAGEGSAMDMRGKVRSLFADPEIQVQITAAELDAAALSRAFRMTGTGGRSTGAAATPERPQGNSIAVTGQVSSEALKYEEYLLRGLSARFGYRAGTLTVKNLHSGISGGRETRIEGVMRGDFSARTDAGANAFRKTLSGSLKADLSRCEMQKTKLSSAASQFTGIPELASPRFDSTRIVLTPARGAIGITASMNSALFRVDSHGALSPDDKLDVAADLRVAPTAEGRIAVPGAAKFLRDDKGWAMIPLRITGTSDRPRVGLDRRAIGSQAGTKAREEVQKRLFELFTK